MNGLYIILLIYSCFMINLVLQCALGIKGVVESKKPIDTATIVKSFVLFFSIVLLWFVFSRLLYSVISGIYIYILIFPVSALVYDGLEYIIFRYLLKQDSKSESIISFPAGITAVAVFICINIADNIIETAVMSLGFTGSIYLINLIVREIRRRAALEEVPVFLRGKPLVLVTMGLLSLIFTTASLLIFRMIGAE